jgi:membrane associated rhomboid family serine protease
MTYRRYQGFGLSPLWIIIAVNLGITLAIVYFVGGICGNLLYLFLGDNYSIAVGASGAIFALGGAMAVMRPNLRVIVFPIFVPIPLWVAVIGGFVLLSFFSSIAWEAHLGGLLVGLAAGYMFRRRGRYYYF